MGAPVIRVENLSKSYRLGQIGTGTFTNDLKLWWAKACGKPNPLLKIGEKDHGNRDGEVVWALMDVSFEVQQGEVLGIIGRNGAGKSTLLKILSRVTAPTSGQIKVKGRVASLLEVGTGFHPELTGRENIYLNGAILGMTKEEVRRKFDEIVAFAEVEKFIDTPVKRYSSGMYVRLAFAVAAHLEPEILVVDEVLAVGDAEFQKKCLGKMGDVAEEGRTVLFVSHNMSAIRQLCREGVIIANGKSSSIKEIDFIVDEYIKSSLSKDRRNVVDLSSYNNPYGANELHVKSIELVNTIDNSYTIRWSDPLLLKIRIEVLQRVPSVSFGLGVKTIDGIPLFTVRSTDKTGQHVNLAEGEYEVLAEVKHNLRAGLYTVLLGISSGKYNYYFNSNVTNIEISDIGNGHYIQNNHGLVNCESLWTTKGF